MGFTNAEFMYEIRYILNFKITGNHLTNQVLEQ